MKVIGKGSVHIWEGIDECPHAPGSDPLWQESFVLVAWDTERKAYVFLRVSQEPNRGPGFSTVWLNAWVPGYMYKRNELSLPLGPESRGPNSLVAGDGVCRFEYDGKFNWTVEDGEVRMQLAMEGYHPGFGYYPEDGGAATAETLSNHIEAVGRVTGSITIAGKTYKFDGPGWRDHSWGKRNWKAVLSHRYYPALFGRDFSFFGVTYVGMDGKFIKAGTIIRDDTVEPTTDFDIVAYVGEDGVSNCGGEVSLRIDGREHKLRYVPIGKTTINMHHIFPCVDTMCEVTMDGRRGVGFTETSHRAQGGTNRPFVHAGSCGIIENGLHAV